MIGYICILSILLLMFGCGVRYRNNILNRMEPGQYKLYWLFPVFAFWFDKVKYFHRQPVKRKMELYRMLYPGKDGEQVFYLETYQRFSIMYVVIFLLCILSFILKATNHAVLTSEWIINRRGAGLSGELQQISVILSEKENELKETFDIEIPSREYDEKEVNEFLVAAKEYVLEKIKGDNASLDNVTESLNLVTDIEGNPFSVSWILTGQKFINDNGSLNNKELKEMEYTTIKACFTYQSVEEYLDIPIGIAPYEWTWEEKAKEDFLSAVKQQDLNSSKEKSFHLPSKIGDVEVRYVKKFSDKSKQIMLCAVLGCVSLWVYWEESLKRQKKKYEEECQRIYPEIVCKITLLLGAGMTLKGAWRRIIADYNKGRKQESKKSYVYEEMVVTWNEMESGVSELEAFAEFGKRMKLRCYLRLSSLITQNMKKGTRGFLALLENEAKEAQEERKQLARKLGEEASSKLLFPMMIMLIIVLGIVMVPAFLSFSKGGL